MLMRTHVTIDYRAIALCSSIAADTQRTMFAYTVTCDALLSWVRALVVSKGRLL